MYMGQKVVFEACSVSILSEIVTDDVIYDCSSFVNKHPGGESVVQSFGGQNCSCSSLKRSVVRCFSPRSTQGNFCGSIAQSI